MRTLGLGNRPSSKKKNCKSWGVYRGGGEGFESCIINYENNQPLFTGFFFIFHQDIAIIKVYCFKLKT